MRPRRIALVLAVLSVLLLPGCGARPTGHGAAPYAPEASVAPPAPLRTRYPALGVRFTLPPMAADDRFAVGAFLGFELATLRTFRSGHPDPALRRWAAPRLRRLVVRQTPYVHGGQLPDLVEIRSADTRNRLSGLRVCAHQAGTASAIAALVVQDDRGRWRVSAIGPDRRPLRHCS